MTVANKVMVEKLRYTIASDFAQGRDVQKQILDAVARHRYDDDSVFGIKLALEEAIVNAIKHGNKLDPHKKVHVEADVSDKHIDVSVEDEGPGFVRKEVPDPCAEENLTKCSGRGLLLMETYMDKIEYSKGGRRIRMVKKKH